MTLVRCHAGARCQASVVTDWYLNCTYPAPSALETPLQWISSVYRVSQDVPRRIVTTPLLKMYNVAQTLRA